MSNLSKNAVIALALLGAGFTAAWLRFRGHLGSDGLYSDGAREVDIGEEPVRYAVWQSPEKLGGDVNTSSAESRPALSPDGRQLVFAVGERGANSELYVADVVDGVPRDPRPIASLDTDADESAPAFGAGGLYFASDRPGGAGGLDLYVAPWENGAAGPAVHLAGECNSPADDTDPAPMPGSDTLAFASNRGDAGFELLLAQRPEADAPYTASPLASLCTKADEREPSFTPDGRAILFASDRAGGSGGFDVYRSFRLPEGWTEPRGLDGINSIAGERAPLASADGFELFFARSEAASAPDLFRAKSLELFQLPGRPIGWLELLVLATLLALALLAYLAKRWPALDWLYKCFLFSAIVHLLLLWWFHYVYMHGGNATLRHRDQPIRVRLLPHEELPIAERRERAGHLEMASADAAAERARAELALAGPERPTLTPASLTAAEPEPTVSARPATPEPSNESAPARDRELAAAAAESARAAVPLADSAEPMERLTGDAPELALNATHAAAERSGTAPATAPRSYSASAMDRAAAPAPGERLVAAGAEQAPAPTERAAVEPPTNGRPNSRELALAQPATEPARASASSAEFSLGDVASSAHAARTGASAEIARGPERGAVAQRSSATDAAPAPSTDVGSLTPRAEADAPAPRAGSAAASLGPADRVTPGARQLALAQPAREAAREGGRSAEMSIDSLASSGSAVRSDSVAEVAQAPARGSIAAPSGTANAAASPSSSTGRITPRAETEAPAPRADSGAAALGPTSGAGHGASEVALAQPAAEPARASGSAAEFSLSGLANAGNAPRGERADGVAQSPTRGELAVPRGDAAPAPSSHTGTVAARPEVESPAAPRGGSAADALHPAGRASGEVALHADAPAPRIASNDGAGSSSSPAFDIGRASALAPSARSNVAADVAPARGQWSTATGDDAPAAPANARVASAAAPREEPGPAAPQKWDHTPYQNRSGEGKARALELHGGSAETERAVALGLKYLASIQRQEGNWGDLEANDPKYGHVAVGKTGLCLLAFLGAGHTHASDTPYSRNVHQALAFLLAVQDEHSGHFGESSAYDHGIATYALAECYALTHDAELRVPLERAVAHILAEQSHVRDPRLFGGWGYYFADDREFDRWSRTSITAWQVMALESARLSGIEVPDAAFTDAATFLRRAEDTETGAYRYNHDPERLSSGYPTLPASTPAALFALSLMGEDLASERHAAAREFILERAPDDYRYTSDDDFVHRAQGNLYFWYYATLALFRTGGAPWERWNAHLKDALLPAQSADGSWKPIDIYARYARDSREDKSYTTAMCVLSLEVYYRYYLPLLKVK